MAAEALDIKTLTTLIMATPKTDIEQAVGRILREKHSQPIVVDIIDKHDIFQKQWLKRKRFYKSQNYKIIETSSSKYVPDTSTWKISYQPHVHSQKSCDKPENENKKAKNKSFSDRSITSDSDASDAEADECEDDSKEKDKFSVGKCLLVIKKKN
jgi:hypothetical protein